jgi:putative two-component system response regulator
MSYYSKILAEHYGLPAQECELILNASPMHDIGKLGIPDSILLKPGRLTHEEFTVMKTHTTIGARLLENARSPITETARIIALTHHEKWDGNGYPHGLAGENIPLVGRIVAITDVFDALTSERPYKSAWPIEKAIEEIKRSAGTHFDPELVEYFIKALPEMLEISQMYRDEPVAEEKKACS